jgi:hypothetical protein
VGLHAVQLGRGLRLLGVEGEVLASLGLKMLGIYSKGVTFAMGYTNATQVYLPSTEELPQNGYEVDSYWEYHWPSPLAAGGEEPLLAELRRLRDTGVLPDEGA